MSTRAIFEMEIFVIGEMVRSSCRRFALGDGGGGEEDLPSNERKNARAFDRALFANAEMMGNSQTFVFDSRENQLTKFEFDYLFIRYLILILLLLLFVFHCSIWFLSFIEHEQTCRIHSSNVFTYLLLMRTRAREEMVE